MLSPRHQDSQRHSAPAGNLQDLRSSSGPARFCSFPQFYPSLAAAPTVVSDSPSVHLAQSTRSSLLKRCDGTSWKRNKQTIHIGRLNGISCSECLTFIHFGLSARSWYLNSDRVRFWTASEEDRAPMRTYTTPEMEPMAVHHNTDAPSQNRSLPNFQVTDRTESDSFNRNATAINVVTALRVVSIGIQSLKRIEKRYLQCHSFNT